MSGRPSGAAAAAGVTEIVRVRVESVPFSLAVLWGWVNVWARAVRRTDACQVGSPVPG